MPAFDTQQDSYQYDVLLPNHPTYRHESGLAL